MIQINKRLLSLDPSINYLGYALFYDTDLVDHGVHKTWKGYVTPPDRQRLQSIVNQVKANCELFDPGVVVIEDWQWRWSDTKRNKDVLKKLIWAIGMCFVAVPQGIDVVAFKPHEWKANKKKEFIVQSAKIAYGIKGKLNHNAADAIMLGHHYIKGVENAQVKMGV